MPVQGRLGGPLGYTPSRARQAGTADAGTAPPLQELQDQLSQILTSLRDDRDPGASPGMPSSRDALPSRDDTSLLDALSSREGLASRNALPSGDAPLDAAPLSPTSRDGLAAQDSLLSRGTPPPRSSLPRDVLLSRDAPPLWPGLFPNDGLHSRETTSLQDTPLSPDAVPPPPPAPPSKGDLISSAGPRSLPDDAVDLGLAPPTQAISRREFGPSRASGTGSASVADAAWKRKKRPPQVFKGDVALKELWSSLAADQTPELPLAPKKTPIFASTARLRVVVLATGGALGLLWATPANHKAGEEAALASLRATPRPAAQDVVVERAPEPPPAAAQAAAAGAALYQDFQKWRQRQLQGR